MTRTGFREKKSNTHHRLSCWGAGEEVENLEEPLCVFYF